MILECWVSWRKKTNAILVTSLIGALINVLVNFVFIQLIGLYAVLLSSLLAFLAVWLIRVYAAHDYFKITVNRKDMVVLFPVMIMAIVAPFVLGRMRMMS